jgi:UMF1 family MFS transporter
MTPQTSPTARAAATSHASSRGGTSSASRRARRGWILYDVANSAFVTTVVTALGGPYLTALAEAAAGTGGRVDLLGWEPRAGSVYAYATSASVVVQVLLLPLLGALADRARGKQLLLAWGTAVGVLATLAFAAATAWQLAALALLVANVAFGAAIVAYNAFLADVAPPDERDAVSSQGFAAGYLGGAAVLALALVALKVAPAAGVSNGTVVRGAVVLAGLWWGGFGLVALRRLAHVERAGSRPAGPSLARQVATSARELRVVAGELRRLPLTARFLVAFLLFNDAIQAVVALSSVFLTQELYVADGRDPADATSFLLGLVLMIQVVAVLGALGFARLAARVGSKNALLVSLVGWVAVVLYAFLALETTGQAWALGAVIALVLGGSQALARSLFSLMVPDGRQAAFFGIYELAERGTAWIGALVFAVVVDATGSYRLAILSLLVLFVSGGLLLATTDTDAAIRAAGQTVPGRTPRPPATRAGGGRPPTDRTYRVLLRLLRGLVAGCTRTRRRSHGLPVTGPVLVVGNHLSVADGFVLVDTVAREGRRVRMMGTAGLFRAPVVGPVLRRLGFIPVFRRSPDPAAALEPAAAALARGECVGLYPEGRITTAADHRPGRGKTGVVRLALDSGAPVVPVVQWGTQHVVSEGSVPRRLRQVALLPFRRPPVEVVVGPPLDLRAALGVASAAQASPELLRVGADLVMAAVGAHVEVLAGQASSGLGDRRRQDLAVAVDRVPVAGP